MDKYITMSPYNRILLIKKKMIYATWMNLKLSCWVKEARLPYTTKRVYTLWFFSYKFPKNANRLIVMESRSMVAWGQDENGW